MAHLASSSDRGPYPGKAKQTRQTKKGTRRPPARYSCHRTGLSGRANDATEGRNGLHYDYARLMQPRSLTPATIAHCARRSPFPHTHSAAHRANAMGSKGSSPALLFDLRSTLPPKAQPQPHSPSTCVHTGEEVEGQFRGSSKAEAAYL